MLRADRLDRLAIFTEWEGDWELQQLALWGINELVVNSKNRVRVEQRNGAKILRRAERHMKRDAPDRKVPVEESEVLRNT